MANTKSDHPTNEERRPGEPRYAGLGHVPALDGVRGVAILLVMIHHFAYGAVGDSLAAKAFVSFCEAGWMGVDLFFVLSGFLISGILLDAREESHYFRNFYARRTLRIFPLYYGYLFLVCVVIARFTGWDQQRSAELLSYESWLWLYGTNVLICIRGAFLVASVNHFWSLAIEEHFYLLWPAVVRWIPPRRMWVAGSICVAIAVGSRCLFHFTETWTMAPAVLTVCRVDSLALGGILAALVRNGGMLPRLQRASRNVILMTAPFVVIFVFGHGQSWETRLLHTVGYTIIGAFFTAVLARILFSRGALKACFAHPFLQFFGRYAYGLYVFHHPLRIALQRALPFQRLGDMIGSYWIGLALHATIACILSVIVAIVSYHLFEKQFLQLKRFFAYRQAAQAVRPEPVHPTTAARAD